MGTERSTHTALAEMREFGEEPSRIGDVRCGELQDLVRRELELLGENPARDGLVKTPMRVSRAPLVLMALACAAPNICSLKAIASSPYAK